MKSLFGGVCVCVAVHSLDSVFSLLLLIPFVVAYQSPATFDLNVEKCALISLLLLLLFSIVSICKTGIHNFPGIDLAPERERERVCTQTYMKANENAFRRCAVVQLLFPIHVHLTTISR